MFRDWLGISLLQPPALPTVVRPCGMGPDGEGTACTAASLGCQNNHLSMRPDKKKAGMLFMFDHKKLAMFLPYKLVEEREELTPEMD